MLRHPDRGFQVQIDVVRAVLAARVEKDDFRHRKLRQGRFVQQIRHEMSIARVLKRRGRQIQPEHRVTVLQKPFRDRGADAAGGSGNQDIH